MSTPTRPKQLLPLAGPRPLVADTVDRARALTSDSRMRILAGERLVTAIRSVLPNLTADAFWIEPQARGTGPALAWAAWQAARADPEAVLLSLHADHAIQTTDAFVKGALAAAALADRERALVTIGIEPTRPETAYGYIKPGEGLEAVGDVPAFRVTSFHEKPDRDRAEQLIGQGYLWNSGIFAWRADVFLEELARHASGIAGALRHLEAGNPSAFFGEAEAATVDEAVLERSSRIAAIVAPFRWDDVGSWEGLARARGAAEGENVVVGTGRVVDGSDNVVYAEDGTLVVWGLDDVVAVKTAGTTLVMRRDLAPDLKRLLDQLPEHLRHTPG